MVLKAKIWYRWWRWRQRNQGAGRSGALVLGCMAAVVLADAYTKLLIATPSWGWHHAQSPSWTLLPGLLFLLWRPLRWPAALMLGGAVANSLWMYAPSGVANPFVANAADGVGLGDAYAFTTGAPYAGAVAYNLADVCITVGTYWIFLAFLAWAARGWKARYPKIWREG